MYIIALLMCHFCTYSTFLPVEELQDVIVQQSVNRKHDSSKSVLGLHFLEYHVKILILFICYNTFSTVLKITVSPITFLEKDGI